MEFKNKKTALILEGGALRSFFTCGVLDVFMENDIYFPCVCGVSAGSLCGINYLSKQIGRTAKVNLDFVNDKRYISLKSLVKDKMIFNFDFLFGEISHELVPLDYDAFYNNKEQDFYAFTTDCETGKMHVFEKESCTAFLNACRASSSIPILSKEVEVEGKNYLDGGVANPIPYQWVMENGYEKIVLVLTRDITYRKKSQSGLMKMIYRRKYKNHPGFLEAVNNIPEHYNELAENIVKLENEGKLFVIRPQEPVTVKRIDHDKEKLKALYKTGREIGEKSINAMMEYIND
ncbi:MAG: patatin family protein [Ruminococcus sp.]|nr:patatin family protein [Ruminococcus sp.]